MAAVYGTNFGCVKLLEESMDPTSAGAARFLLSALVLLPMARPAPPKVFLAGMETGLWCALGYAAQAVRCGLHAQGCLLCWGGD